MSEVPSTPDAVEQVTQDVKAVKLENGAAPGAANGTKPEDNAVSFKVTGTIVLRDNSPT